MSIPQPVGHVPAHVALQPVVDAALGPHFETIAKNAAQGLISVVHYKIATAYPHQVKLARSLGWNGSAELMIGAMKPKVAKRFAHAFAPGQPGADAVSHAW